MRVMDSVLRDQPGKSYLVYEDDVPTWKSTYKKTDISFPKIRRFKTEGAKVIVEFLGYVITPNGIKPSPKKSKLFESSNRKEIKSVLSHQG